MALGGGGPGPCAFANSASPVGDRRLGVHRAFAGPFVEERARGQTRVWQASLLPAAAQEAKAEPLGKGVCACERCVGGGCNPRFGLRSSMVVGVCVLNNHLRSG